MRLHDFFVTMNGLINGTLSPEAAEARLGPSPSGPVRLGLYPTLVARQRTRVLDVFFDAVAVAAELVRPRWYQTLRDGFLTAHPPRHWYPVESGRLFSEYLATAAAVAPALAELADYAWARHVVQIASHDDHPGLGATLQVRHYQHAVASFSASVSRGHLLEDPPAPIGETWLIGRSRISGAPVLVAASRAALVALMVMKEGQWPSVLPDGLTHELLRREVDQLVASGLLGAGAEAALPR